ncbi:hypothetical protein O181_042012 [Austropuccinia psidii MF-1]|uniref:Intermembrane lipid transfer protein VPS13-like C-terminal domain-containing protein n=1 Tax=Austropuccinia psidii MF-1 TaxID=1389203 RepID=A0A9Q3DHT1_9BASI|nr:hypothetical protein [Austropuccinia psidii MF-1]
MPNIYTNLITGSGYVGFLAATQPIPYTNTLNNPGPSTALGGGSNSSNHGSPIIGIGINLVEVHLQHRLNHQQQLQQHHPSQHQQQPQHQPHSQLQLQLQSQQPNSVSVVIMLFCHLVMIYHTSNDLTNPNIPSNSQHHNQKGKRILSSNSHNTKSSGNNQLENSISPPSISLSSTLPSSNLSTKANVNSSNSTIGHHFDNSKEKRSKQGFESSSPLVLTAILPRESQNSNTDNRSTSISISHPTIQAQSNFSSLSSNPDAPTTNPTTTNCFNLPTTIYICKAAKKNEPNTQLQSSDTVRSIMDSRFEATTITPITSLVASINLDNNGLSIIDKRLRELIYTSFRVIEITYEESQLHKEYRIMVCWIKLDNQLDAALFPVLFRPTDLPIIPQDAEMRPTLQINSHVVNDDKHVVAYIKKKVDGLATGTSEFVGLLASSILGIAMKLIEGAENKGAVGFLKGLGKQLVGVFAKPAFGNFEFLSKVCGGLRNAKTVFDPNHAGRTQWPRHIAHDRILKPYKIQEAQRQDRLQSVENGKLHSCKYVDHIELPNEVDSVCMLTTTRVVMIHTNKLKIL